MVKTGGKKKRPGEGRERRTREVERSRGGGDRHIVMGGDEGMNCRHAAVDARWSREDGGSGSSPVFLDVRADRGSRGREGVNEQGNSQSDDVALTV